MICNKCQKEMPDFGDFCPYCGAPKEIAPEETAVPEVAPEEIVAAEAAAEAAVVEETPEEVLAQEEKEEAAEEAPVQEKSQEKENRFAAILSQTKEKLAQFFNKVRVTVPEENAEEEAPAAEEAPAEPAPEETVEAPVRRRPSDAFNIDFPVEEEKKEDTTEETAAEEAPAEAEQEQKDAAEETPSKEAPVKKKIKPLYLVLAIVGCAVLLTALVFAVLVGMGVDIGPRENDLYYKNSYTVDEDVLAKKADVVVATIGDRELTVSELQLYYIESIYNFYTQNQYYMAMMGIDPTIPLNQQQCIIAENMTWEQYFLDGALKTWQSYTWVDMLAQEDNYVIPADIQAQMDQMTAQLQSIALAYGHADAAEYLSAEVAPGVSLESYVYFNNIYVICNQYISDYYTKDYPTEEEIRAYYKENEGLFIVNSITEDMGQLSSVRHILIQPQGGTTDELGNTTYSEEEEAAALAEAERILEEWKAGEATEESFAELASTYTMDTASSATGGLYEDISIDSSYVEEFRAWAVDSARQTGDTEIVKTSYGYHIMYFVEGEDYFLYQVAQQLIADRLQVRLTALREANPVEIDYKKIVLCEKSFS